VRVDDAPAWRFGSGAFTVELWAKLDPAQDPNNAVFVAHDTTSASNKWIFWLWTDGVKQRVAGHARRAAPRRGVPQLGVPPIRRRRRSLGAGP
jgi:hypothetical protein